MTMREIMALIFLFIVLIGFVILGIWFGEPKESPLRDELMQLYTFNYTETSNPTKKIRLRAALKRLQEYYQCEPSSLPDLRLRCEQKLSDSERDIINRLMFLLEEKK